MRYNPEHHSDNEEVHQALRRHDFVTARKSLGEKRRPIYQYQADALQGLSLFCLEETLQPSDPHVLHPEGRYFLTLGNNTQNPEADYFLTETRDTIRYDEHSQHFRPSHALEIIKVQLQHPEVFPIQSITPTVETLLDVFTEFKQGRRERSTKTYLHSLLQIAQVLSILSDGFIKEQEKGVIRSFEAGDYIQALVTRSHQVTDVALDHPARDPFEALIATPLQQMASLSQAIFYHAYTTLANQQIRNKAYNEDPKNDGKPRKNGPYYDTLAVAFLETNTASSNGLVEFLLKDSEFAHMFEDQEGFKKWKEERIEELQHRNDIQS